MMLMVCSEVFISRDRSKNQQTHVLMAVPINCFHLPPDFSHELHALFALTRRTINITPQTDPVREALVPVLLTGGGVAH